MYKFKVLAVLLILTLSLTACGSVKSSLTNDSRTEETKQETESHVVEKPEEPQVTEQETHDEVQQEEVTETSNEIRSEVKEAIDSYASFIDDYCEFLENYDSTNVLQLAQYAEMMSTYADMAVKFEAIENEDLNDAEALYYAEISLKCSQRLLETSAGITSDASDVLSGLSGLLGSP
ncbi:MAG: hypothetical protein IJ091_10325 [Oscillospiraceae bacterium]|nr:hypothetical protein [Oscillospiraceae bacterium]